MKSFFAAVAGVLMAAGAATADVTMSGVGTVKAQPDMAHVSITVHTEGKTANEATSLNSKSVKSVCEAVEFFKVDVKDIQTQWFNVAPKYEHFSEKVGNKLVEGKKQVGFTSTTTLSVTVRDITKLGAMLDKVSASGASEVSGLQWDVADRSSLMAKARWRAFVDAQNKAKLYAKAGEFKLGKVKSISEAGYFAPRMEGGPYVPQGNLADRPPVPTNPGEIEFQIRVNVIWTIE